MAHARTMPGHRWFLAVLAGLAACASLLVIPVDSPLWVFVSRGTGVVAVAAFAVAARRMPTRTRAVWWLMWTYAALTVAADIVYDVQQRVFDELPFPGPADVLYLAAYVAAIAGLLLLVRRAIPDRDRDAWIDTAVIAVAVASVVGYLVARPMVLHSDQTGLALIIMLTYPFLDIVVLAGLIRLVIGGARSTVALALLAVAFLTTLSADLFYNVVVNDGSDGFSPPLLDAAFLVAITLMAASAWTPDAKMIDASRSNASAPSDPVRLIGLALGVLTIPILLVYTAWSDVTMRRLALASIIVILLVIWRLERVLSTVRRQHALLDLEARTDALTGLPNRRTLDYEVERAIEVAEIEDSDLTVAMLDLDHFKAFNDEHGHQAGDRLLATCARAWRDVLPSEAFLARYGGEEFAVLLPGVGGESATPLLDRLRAAMPPHRTVSIGYAVRDERETGRAVLRRADAALYEAKERGRDRIVAAW